MILIQLKQWRDRWGRGYVTQNGNDLGNYELLFAENWTIYKR